jgi:hypothetical protein
MSILSLQKMVGKAIVSDEYRAGILNGHKAELIRELDLDPEEATQVMAIRASTLAEFAAAVDQIVRLREAINHFPTNHWHGTTNYLAR